jgi:hypothetical protein
MEDDDFGSRLGDSVLAALTRAANTAIDLEVYERTGGDGIPKTIGNRQQLVRPVRIGDTSASSAAMPGALLQWLPLILAGGLVVFIVAKLARK